MLRKCLNDSGIVSGTITSFEYGDNVRHLSILYKVEKGTMVMTPRTSNLQFVL